MLPIQEMFIMDKMIFSVGIALIGLGLGFLILGSVDYSLSSAFTTGGYLWLVVGGATLGLGMKVNRSRKQQLGALR